MYVLIFKTVHPFFDADSIIHPLRKAFIWLKDYLCIYTNNEKPYK